jgi:calcineurin-like phosphoesterase family protein
VVRVLAVSDEVDEGLYANLNPVRGVDLILACGDLPFDYLAHLVEGLEVPAVFVPGNHDPDVSGYTSSRGGLTLRAGLPTKAPWPIGAVNADGRVVDIAGLRIAGLGGSPRYSGGPNQYTNRQFAWRARRLRVAALAAKWRTRDGRPIDVLITHAPPLGVGDDPDPPHRGFRALPGLVGRLRPGLMLHGHVHPYGRAMHDQHIGATVVRNVVGRHVFDIPSAVRYTEIRAGHRLPES